MMDDDFLNQLTTADLEVVVQEDQILKPLLPEINLIADPGTRSLVRAVLVRAGPFWEIPASAVSHEHPPDEYLPGGNVLHTARVARLSAAMADSYGLEAIERDGVIAASLLHDVTKAVDNGEIQYDPLHPYTVGAAVYAIQDDERRADNLHAGSSSLLIDPEMLEQVLRIVRCHLGIASPIPETLPAHPLEWLVHQADYIACRLHLIQERNVLWP
jgi:HD superfamily phosphohydrolase YqeK